MAGSKFRLPHRGTRPDGSHRRKGAALGTSQGVGVRYI
jgi:hypothetical protein